MPPMERGTKMPKNITRIRKKWVRGPGMRLGEMTEAEELYFTLVRKIQPTMMLWKGDDFMRRAIQDTIDNMEEKERLGFYQTDSKGK